MYLIVSLVDRQPERETESRFILASAFPVVHVLKPHTHHDGSDLDCRLIITILKDRVESGFEVCSPSIVKERHPN